MIVKYYYIKCIATQYNTLLVIHRIDTCASICAFMNTSLMMQIIICNCMLYVYKCTVQCVRIVVVAKFLVLFYFSVVFGLIKSLINHCN
jgi:hypothetical protein